MIQQRRRGSRGDGFAAAPNKRTLLQFIGDGVVSGTITSGGRAEMRAAAAWLSLKRGLFSRFLDPNGGPRFEHAPAEKQGDV